jgi:AraC-like DNA-binding protein
MTARHPRQSNANDDRIDILSVCGDRPALPSESRVVDARTADLLVHPHALRRTDLAAIAGHQRRPQPAYTATLFHRQTGTTIHRYLTRTRMRRAAMLLRRSEKVEAVMLQVGYRGKKNFYRQFEIAFGVTPGQYKANHARAR